MIHPIQGFTASQIEELKQCPGITIDTENHFADVPFVAEGLFLSIAASREQVQPQADVQPIPVSEKETLEQISDENLYLKNFELDEAKKLLHKQSNEDSGSEKICARCGKTGERFCYGKTRTGAYKFRFFCLKCYSHHFE